MNKDSFRAVLKTIQDKVAGETPLSELESMILMLATRWNPGNTYDFLDRVNRVAEMRAGPLKIAAYTVADPQTLEHGKMQFHMTWDNTVMALMSEEAAKLFTRFVADVLNISVHGRTHEPNAPLVTINEDGEGK